MNRENFMETEDIEKILRLYGIDEAFDEPTVYINDCDGDDYLKLIFSVTLANGKRVVIKLVYGEVLVYGEIKEADLHRILENQSIFSEFMRNQGIRTPKRYQSEGQFCREYIYRSLPCSLTLEDWCGHELTEINIELAEKIGRLMAEMHMISFKHHCEIGRGTLFSAAYANDVEVYEDFCRLCQDERLAQDVVERIKKVYNTHIEKLRAVWDGLPKTALQGDISINNLVYEDGELTIFDYNYAGDEVMVSHLVLEGLLTAYEMELPQDVDKSYREALFPALLKGYLSVRALSEEEMEAAWLIYTTYHALWFSRIKYNEESLEKLVARGDYISANYLLREILNDITEPYNGMFGL